MMLVSSHRISIEKMFETHFMYYQKLIVGKNARMTYQCNKFSLFLYSLSSLSQYIS